MRKNYILALLATGVVPMSAFAAIDIPGVATDKGGWDLSGVSDVQTDAATGMIEIPGAQGGYPACTIEKLPAGDYVITASLVNAKLEVFLDGTPVALNADGTFTTTKAGNLLIEVKAVDKSASYQFGNVTLALDVDLDQIYQSLVALMPTGALTAPSQWMADYNTDEITGNDVIAEYNKLSNPDTIADLNAEIAAVNPTGKTADEQLNAYKAYVAKDVQGQVEAYAQAVNEYQNGITVTDEDGNVTYSKYPIATINLWADTLHNNIVNHNKDLKAIDNNVKNEEGYTQQLKDLEETIASTQHTDALATEIAAANQAIQDALADIATNWAATGVQVGKADYVRVSMQPIIDAIQALKNAYNQLLGDEDRYTNLWLPDYERLTNEYINAQQVIKDLYENEPGRKARQDSVMAGVTKIYNDAVNSLAVKYGQGKCTAAEYTADNAKIEQAILDLKARVQTDEQCLADEQAALGAGTTLVGGAQADLDLVDIHDDAYKKADLDTAQAALQAKVEALQKKIDDIYASTEVLTDTYVNGDFTAEVNAVKAEIAKFAAQVAVANQLGALRTDLNAARTQISEDDNNTYLKNLPTAYAVDVVDMMAGSYDSIVEAIEQQEGIYDQDYTQVQQTAIDSLKASINGDTDSYLTNGLKMASDFADAYRIALPAKIEADRLVDFIKNNNPAFNVKITSTLAGVGVNETNGVDQVPYKNAANAYQTKADDTVVILQNARKEAPQNAFDAIEEVMNDQAVLDLLTNIKAEKVDYLKAVIGSQNGDNSNLEELHTALDALTAQYNNIGTYAGFADVDKLYQEALAGLTDVDTAFNAVPNVQPDQARAVPEIVPADKQLININADAKALIAKFQGVQNEIDKVVKNYDAYQRVLALVQQIVDQKDSCDTFADANSLQPARDSWKALIEENVNKATDLKSQKIDQTYEDVEMLFALTLDKTNEDLYTDQLKEILDWFSGYETAVLTNEQAHNILLNESGEITSLVDEVNQTIEAAEVPIILTEGENAGKNAAEVLKKYNDELSDLDTDLYNVYKDLKCKGQEELTTTLPATLMDQYEALRAKINDLRAQLDSDYAKALKAYNEQFIADNWSGYRSNMMEVFDNAIINLDRYQVAVESCPSLAENAIIQDGVDHAPIYGYATPMQELIAEVPAMLDKSWPTLVNGAPNAQQRKLTDADLAPYIARAEAIMDGIGTTYTDKVEQINTEAEQILDAKKYAVGRLISRVGDELRAAGCDQPSIDKTLKEATLAYDRAENIASTPLGGTLQPEYVESIAAAINLLDGIDITDAQMLAAAVSTFNNAVTAKANEIQAAQDTLDGATLPASITNALQASIDNATKKLNQCKKAEITLENLKDNLALVNAIDVAAIQAAIDQAIADNDANNAAKIELDGLVNNLQANLNALNGWVEKLLVAGEVPMTVLQADVTAVQNAIDAAYNEDQPSDNLSNTANVNALKAQITALQNKIDQPYAKAYRLELNRLNDEVLEARRAYNEASKRYAEETGVDEFPDTEKGREYTAKIDAEILALANAYLPEGTVPTVKQQNKIVDIQSNLLNIQIDLEYLSAADVVASLNEAAENAIATINASAANLGNYSKPVYEPKYDELIAEVEALQKQWTENVATVIVQEGVYLRDINNIVNDKLAALDAEAAAYQADREANAEHEAASDAAYKVLNAQLGQVENAYNATSGYAQTYASRLTTAEIVSLQLAAIANDIDAEQSALDTAKASFDCVDFTWTQPLANIYTAIDNANLVLWKAVTLSYKGEASQAIADAKDALENGKTHTNADGFAAAISSLSVKLNKLAVVMNGNAAAGEKFVAAAEDIISSAEALFKAIVDAEYTPGDITGTGSVTADDYEALIDLLGQIENPEEFDNPAYDVNGDGSVTMADIATIIDILMGRETNSAVMARMPMINTNNAIYVVKTSNNNGITRYALILNNTADLFGAQMDIILSEGMEIVNEGVAERTAGNEFYGSTTYSGKHRIILSSINMNTFIGSEGAIVYLDVQGEGELTLDNVLGVDTTGRMYNINVMTNVTGIESIEADGKNADIFNVAGQKLNRTQRGAVNIIRTADGKTSKIINK